MMNGVHAGSYQHSHQQSFESERHPHVAVMEKDAGEENRLPQPDRERCRADERDLSGAVEDGEDELTEMKAQRSRRVEVEVDVMHEVKTPEKRNEVRGPMPPPQCVVETDQT